MAPKNKDLKGYFLKLSKLYEEIIADRTEPGLLDELDGDRRILAHAAFYIASKTLSKKLYGLEPFELVRLVEESMLRLFITNPNSERVDELLEKADLLYELLPYIISNCIDDEASNESYRFPEKALYEAQGLLVAARDYAMDTDEDELDPVLDSLSLRTGKVGSPIIDSDTDQIREDAQDLAYDIENYYDDPDGIEDGIEAPTIADLQGLDRERQMLVIGLMSINMDSLDDQMEHMGTKLLKDNIITAISAFDEGKPAEDIDQCIHKVIESIKAVVGNIMNENRPHDKVSTLFSIIFTSILSIYIHDAQDLSDNDFAKVWSKVYPDGKFDNEALISYSQKVVDRDLPDLLKDFNEN